MERTGKALKNVIYSIFSYGTLFILSLILRKVFLKYLDTDYLGLEGVFDNMFSLMALVDVGTGSLITYLLYQAFSKKDKKEVSLLMSMYKQMYLFIGLLMGLISVFVIPLLPYLIKSAAIEWKYVIWIYIIKCIGMVGTYCYSYRRLIFKVDQCDYVCTKIDTFFSYLKYFLWFIVLLAFKSYFLYLIVNVLAVLLANIYIAYLSYKKYPYSNGGHARIKDYREKNFFKDMKNTYLTKLAGAIFGSTDNLVISAFMGLKYVAILSNYLLITDTISNSFAKLLMPLQGSIGNYVYTECKSNGIKLFKMFDRLAFIIGSIIVCCYINVVNDFVSVWLGDKFCFSQIAVVCIGLRLYFGFVSHFTSCYRDFFGKFEIDRNYNFLGAILNIVISILAVKKYGIPGVYIGTIFGMIGFWYGRYKVLYKDYFKENIGYVSTQVKNFMLMGLMTFLCSLICRHLSPCIGNILIKIVICVIVTSIINFVIFWRTEEMKMISSYLNKVISIVFKR